jgi:hypothetical protein
MAKYAFTNGGKYYEVQTKGGNVKIAGEVQAIYYKQGANFAIKIVGTLGVCHDVFPTLKDAAQAVLLHYIRAKKQ